MTTPASTDRDRRRLRDRWADPRLRIGDRRLNRPPLPYLGPVDGLRGLAIAALVLGHGGAGFVRGGDTALSTHFALIGFVLTTVLVAEDERTPHEIDVDLFWWERLRRLVPGLLAALVVSLVVIVLGTQAQKAVFRFDALAVLAQAGNWRFLARGAAPASAWAATPTASPVLHLWSLGVLVQLLVLLPMFVFTLVQTSIHRRYAVAGALGVLALGSAGAAVAVGPRPGAYFGTWVHAGALLFGGVLACVLYDRQVTVALARNANVRFWLGLAGPAALTALVAAWVLARPWHGWLWRGGWAGLGLLTCLVLASALTPGSLLQRLLRLAPLRLLGRHAYGLFLFHWPVMVLLVPKRTGLEGWANLGVQLAATLGCTAVSWHLFEKRILEGKRFLGIPAVPVVLLTTALVAVGILAVTDGQPGVGPDEASIPTSGADPAAGPLQNR